MKLFNFLEIKVKDKLTQGGLEIETGKKVRTKSRKADSPMLQLILQYIGLENSDF